MRVLVFAITLLIPAIGYTECNFRTADYVSSLGSPEFIKSIDIEIPKSSKFARNQLKIFNSKSENIPKKLKKSFKANITVNYRFTVNFRFGLCKYSAKVRQSGDWKDHISLVRGNLIQSLDVNLDNGNVLNATRFKLFIPATRQGQNEVLGALILRELGFISPETFEVNVNVNGVGSVMLFQEKAEKELIERNLRREGPIFEGDESLIWSYQNFSNFELEPLALSRLVNDNWFNKGHTSQIIVTKSFYRLQAAYFDYAYSFFLGKNSFFLNPNKKEDYLFNDYHRLLLAMGGSHALRPHNRKFYFNAIEDRFEPIYYDGSITFTEFIYEENLGYGYLLQGPVSTDLIDRVKKLLTSQTTQQKYLKRIISSSTNHEVYNKKILQVVKNLELFANMSLSDGQWDLLMDEAEISWYQEFQREKNLPQKIVKRLELHKNNVNLYLSDGAVNSESIPNLSKMLSKTEIDGERYVIIPQDDLLDEKQGYKEFYIDSNVVRTSDGIELVLDKKNKTIEFIQHNGSDWVLMLGGDYTNWKITFIGSFDKISSESMDQRFNEFGLTGCLTFYQTLIDSARIKVSDGQCEDSLNLLGVKGSNVTVSINDAFADALDADFSKLDISNLYIKNAGNDCIDVSGGFYSTGIAKLENCSDKALSIGEMSTYEGGVVRVEGADIGISSKDFSQVKVKSFNAKSVSQCGEAKQKKQEFGGGVLLIDVADCNALFSTDVNSLSQVGDL